MTDHPQSSLRTTALHNLHVNAGASMTEFGGWHMPLRYTSQLAEHNAVRQAAGLFDLSHMGEIWVTGPGAADALDFALVSRMAPVRVGRAKYTMICAPDGGIIDDLITYRLGEEVFLVVPNAGNTDQVARELTARAEGFDATVTDVSAVTSMIAVQGPSSEEIVRSLVGEDDADTVRELRYYAAQPLTVGGVDVLLARTGYTGEDGFELMVLPAGPGENGPARDEETVDLWAALARAGADHGLAPAGLACRDTLRLEAGMPLYGNELSRDTDPYTAGLGGLVRLDKEIEGAPVGKDALAAAKGAHEEKAPGRRVLVGLRGEGRRAARAGNTLLGADGAEVGVITSGVLAPTLGYPIALGLVALDHAAEGTELFADVRGTHLPLRIVALPFYSRSS